MKKILINENPWQTRIAITKDDLLQNIYFAAHVENPLERVFFKGVVTKVLPGIQTAFIDIGQEKAGFLHISEIDRELAIDRMTDVDDEDAPIKTSTTRLRQALDISNILKEGEPILVQVSKEPVYEKGAKLTTCFTLPGRFIVLMPNIPRIGISKKIEDREERHRLKDILRELLPEGMGAIIRTTSDGRSKDEIKKDVDFLVDTWNNIQKKFAAADVKERIHEDIELPLQIVRDHLDNDVEEVISDTKESQHKIYRFVKLIAPEYGQRVKLYEGTSTLFEHYSIEKQIEAALDRKVPLKSGGSLIIETTEAMCVVDVNTGKFTGKKSLEETILKTNLEAAQEIVRQLRLRNIGGLIVIDFIDMATSTNRQKLFKVFEKTLREQDKFQSVVLKVSEFGLVQMTRKRSGKSLIQQLTDTCQTCKGLGFVRSLETESYSILRALKTAMMHPTHAHITLNVHEDIFNYITNTEYNSILELEKQYKCKIMLVSQKTFKLNQYKIEKS
ncbi:MAG: Rne/Rng family ribonuclease [Candidatus Dependentiae bacterium]|nr:Rne/Rng family ribonuclease [Candidatus Dependentiae bacterium]